MFPTDPVLFSYGQSDFRVWQNGEREWAAIVDELGSEFHGPNREAVVQAAEKEIDDFNEAPPC